MIEGKPAKEPYLSFYTGGAKIVSYSANGEAGPEITDFENPCSLAVDAKGRLLVGGLNKHSQVWIYDVSENPKKVGTFGTEGGICPANRGSMGRKSFTGSAAWGPTKPETSTSPLFLERGTTSRSKPTTHRGKGSGMFTASATGSTPPAPTRTTRTPSTPKKTSSRWTGLSQQARSSHWPGSRSIGSNTQAITA